jgi:hypothetical protein
MKTIPKPTRRSISRFEYFSACEDTLRHLPTPLDSDGFTALECFHHRETFGETLPCREPVLLDRAINGKEQHGLNVTHLAEDYVGRILFASEIKKNYPEWVQRDVLGRATQIAVQLLGYVPTFVRTGDDFSTLKTGTLAPA